MKRLPFYVLEDFIGLIYPRLCLACGQNLPARQDDFCLTCHHKLPKTDYHLERENRFTERLWGRVPLVAGAAMLIFRKGGLTQQIIHRLKYDGKREVGIRLGEMYGRQLLSSSSFYGLDAIIPVPLHPRKEKIRGYNQSAMFAQGLSNSMAIPCWNDVLKRTAHSASQTKKGVLSRIENVDNIFEVTNPNMLNEKNILLVDDVLTTGATLEACAQALLAKANVKISMATIAIALT